MRDLHVRPVPLKMLRNESPVTMLGSILAAQQTITIEEFSAQHLSDTARLHQLSESARVFIPFALGLDEVVQDVLGRRQVRKMEVADSCNGSEEEFQVASFGEAGNLRGVVQTHIHHTPDPSALKPREELFR